MNANVVAALITGLFAVIVLVLTQYYRDRNKKNPPPPPPIAPATSGDMWEFFLELKQEVKDIRTELDTEKAERETFTQAVRRYLEKLARSWGTPGTMPDPDSADLDILKLTLPKRPPRRKQP